MNRGMEGEGQGVREGGREEGQGEEREGDIKKIHSQPGMAKNHATYSISVDCRLRKLPH